MVDNIFNEYINEYLDLIASAEVIAEIKHPFSVDCMDASFDFVEKTISSIREYCKDRYKIEIEKILIISGFMSTCPVLYDELKLSSKTRLVIFKLSHDTYAAVLSLGAKIKRK